MVDSSTISTNYEFYIKDDDGGYHLVIVTNVKMGADGKIEFKYASSSDLETRGLEKHIKPMVEKYFGGFDESNE